MKTLIKAARIIDSQSEHNQTTQDILVENGLIVGIGVGLTATDARVVELPNVCVSPGWVDLRARAGDPGHEHREDLQTLAAAAAAGGFTDVALMPNTQPALDSKDTIGYVRRATQGLAVRVHPLGAVTKKCEGHDFSEMLDLHHAGALAFTDGDRPIENPDVLLKALQYLRQIDGLLMNRPEDPHLARFGQLNEGITSTLLGMKGIPNLAEELMLARDLKLLQYALLASNYQPNAPILHFSTLSTRRSVALVREAKTAGLPVSCDVAAHQMAFDDTVMLGFDTNYKVNPPFRTPDDVAALWEGLADGTIDAVVSDHHPLDEESKNLEFDLADFGIIGLETAFAVLNTHNSVLTLNQLIDAFTHAPRRILRLPAVRIAQNQPARLTLFDPDTAWTFEKTKSKSKNSPFFGIPLKGNIYEIIA